jgi:hypothetical protein
LGYNSKLRYEGFLVLIVFVKIIHLILVKEGRKREVGVSQVKPDADEQ